MGIIPSRGTTSAKALRATVLVSLRNRKASVAGMKRLTQKMGVRVGDEGGAAAQGTVGWASEAILGT